MTAKSQIIKRPNNFFISQTKVCVLMLFFINFTQCEELYSNEDFKIVQSLGVLNAIKSFVFVKNQNDSNIIEAFKDISRNNSLFSFISRRQLFEVLSDLSKQILFFEAKTMIVIKDEISVLNWLNKISAPHFLIWVIFGNSVDVVKKYHIPFSTDMVVVQDVEDTGLITVDQVYQVTPSESMVVKNIGKGTPDSVSSFPPLHQKSDFENATLRVLINMTECRRVRLKRFLHKVECAHQEMTRLIADRLNFSIKIVDCIEKDHPYNYPNGSLSEMFLMMSRRETDLSAGSFLVSNSRLNEFDFAWPTFTARSMMYIKTDEKNHWRAYLRPFKAFLWISIVFWIILTGALIYIFELFHKGIRYFKIPTLPEAVNSVLESLQIFCNQGLNPMSKWCSNRIIHLMSFLVVLMLYQSYSAQLISSLMVALPDIPFNDLNGFFRDGTYKILSLNRGFHKHFVKVLLTDVRKNGLQYMVEDKDLSRNISDAIRKLCEHENLVYIEFRENMIQQPTSCRIAEISKPVILHTFGLGLPKRSPYQAFIQRELLSLNSMGIVQRMRGKVFTYSRLIKYEARDSNEEYVTVSFLHVASLFVFLIFAMIISGVIFILEIVSHKFFVRAKPRHLKDLKRNTRYRNVIIYPKQKGFYTKVDWY